jgi:two-component system, NarL family, sensor kinase
MRRSTPPPEAGESPAGGSRLDGDEFVRRFAELSLRNERLLRQLIADERRFRRLARAVWKVQEDERRRLALDLHDGVGQTLTALVNHLRRVRQEEAGAAAPGLDQGIELAALALDEVRELSRLLRPAVLDDLGLQSGIRWLVRIMRERAGLATEIDWRLAEDARFDPELETLVFRVVQEGLNNIVKHSGQGEARVAVAAGDGRLELEIADSGRGFDPGTVLADTRGAGLGLRGIRDRIDLFGGRLSIDSAVRRGTRLRVVIPLQGPDS